MPWTVDFCEGGDGSRPVESFLVQLPLEHRAKALAIARLLEEMGPALPFPYSSQVRGKIRELRTQQGKDKIRILYFGDRQRRFILLHGFVKKTDRLSKIEIETAEQRMEEHDRRLGRRQRP